MTPREFAIQVTQQLQEAGYQALWAGGCVRDQLLNKTPKDYDVATNATPDQIRKIFGKRKTLSIGAAFGVITVIGPKSVGNIEIATFRLDSDYSDGRRPDSIEFSTAEMDAQRRDFTINGLFYDPIAEQVIDYVGGQDDLQRKVIRAIGNPAERIAEDKLRMLRAVRFAATLQFELDLTTIETVQSHAAEISVVSAERISAELTRMLLHENRVRAIDLLHQCKLLDEILPELSDSFRNTQSIGEVHARLDRLRNPTMAVAFTTLVSSVVEPSEVGALCRRLKLSNEVSKTGNWILQNSNSLGAANKLPWSTIQPLLIDDRIEQALAFVEAKGGRSSEAVAYCRQRLAWPKDQLDPVPLLDGGVLQQIAIPPGPMYSKIIAECRRAQLDGEIDSLPDALVLARQIASSS